MQVLKFLICWFYFFTTFLETLCLQNTTPDGPFPLVTPWEINQKLIDTRSLGSNNSENNSTSPNNSSTKLIRKTKRMRKRKSRRKTTTTTEKYESSQSVINTIHSPVSHENTTVTNRRRVRKRKYRKRRKFIKQNVTTSTTINSSVVAEITTQNIILTNVSNNQPDTESKDKMISGHVENVTHSMSQTGAGKQSGQCGKSRKICAHFCNVRKGKTRCSCLKGFYLADDGKNCHDIDECKSTNGGCQMTCINTLGSYKCSCPTGLRIADDLKSCEDVNECLLRNGHGPCQDRCENNFGGYKCSCDKLNGMVLAEDGQNCVDVDECAEGNAGCSHICINTIGKAFCACPHGLELSSNWKTCKDVNECKQNSTVCPNGCINTEGSYYCKNSISSLQNDQPLAAKLTKRITCKPLFPPKLGYFKCSRKKSFKFFSKRGRKLTVNSPGTKCRLDCPTGTQIVGQYHVKCGVNGEWIGEQNGKCTVAEFPKIQCPPSKNYTIKHLHQKVLVKFDAPKTTTDWKYVVSDPLWAVYLSGYIGKGLHRISFVVNDPRTKLSSQCSFNINVDCMPK